MTLHLLRGVPPNIDGEAVDIEAFKRLVRRWASQEGTVFGSWTRNAPKRAGEIEGGSVYFVHKRKTVFRMPFLGLERVRDFQPDAEPKYLDHVAICCAPALVLVEPWPVRFLRGWRYLKAEDAPPDLPARIKGDDELPPAIERELKELGLA